MLSRAVASLFVSCVLVAAGSATARAQPLPGFGLLGGGPDGGTLWQGVIPDRFVPGARRVSIVYLPPGYATTTRYPVVYVLHGLPGSPYSISEGLRFADYADSLIIIGRVPAFIGVMPVAGISGRSRGEWTGPWEKFVVRGVIPWTDAHLATVAEPSSRTLAGLSAGGYGAVDIALRHPTLFQSVESWSGYFRPIRDGTLAHAGPATLAAHNPTRLVRTEAALLRHRGVRFFLSAGSSRDRVTASSSRTFAAELSSLAIPHRLYLAPGGHNGAFWRLQLPAALTYALDPPASPLG
jgi:enterochelin esterase-like enzyme